MQECALPTQVGIRANGTAGTELDGSLMLFHSTRLPQGLFFVERVVDRLAQLRATGGRHSWQTAAADVAGLVAASAISTGPLTRPQRLRGGSCFDVVLLPPLPLLPEATCALPLPLGWRVTGAGKEELMAAAAAALKAAETGDEGGACERALAAAKGARIARARKA